MKSFSLLLRRILQTSISNIVRAPFVSFSVVLVMTVTLFIVGFSFLLGNMAQDVVDTLQTKVDTTVYFVKKTPETQILELKKKLEGLSVVKEVEYISQNQALADFQKRHSDDLDSIRGLEILPDNPFSARFSIKAKDTKDYEEIAQFLNNEDITSANKTTIIDKIDYYQNKEVINRLTSAISTTSIFAKLVVALLILISCIIVFNIIRLIIYLSRDEISVMNLIGAENFYIEAPFVVSGGIYGAVSSIAALIFLYPISVWLAPVVGRFFGNESFSAYYISNFLVIMVVLIVLGVCIGAVSSWASTRRYLKS
ncbi:MAG: permease-like cell division protein FtsX [Alphaproteobacteria bacterium]|nr:permease-like cell division protein FtsX [Alphaproteobacteria bacterium]